MKRHEHEKASVGALGSVFVLTSLFAQRIVNAAKEEQMALPNFLRISYAGNSCGLASLIATGLSCIILQKTCRNEAIIMKIRLTTNSNALQKPPKRNVIAKKIIFPRSINIKNNERITVHVDGQEYSCNILRFSEDLEKVQVQFINPPDWLLPVMEVPVAHISFEYKDRVLRAEMAKRMIRATQRQPL